MTHTLDQANHFHKGEVSRALKIPALTATMSLVHLSHLPIREVHALTGLPSLSAGQAPPIVTIYRVNLLYGHTMDNPWNSLPYGAQYGTPIK